MEFNKEKLKSLWNDLTDKASAAAKTAAKKTGEVAESAKLTITLKSEQSKLSGLFANLGKLYYDQQNGEDNTAKLAAQIMEIDEQKKVIADLKATIAEHNGKVFCQGCGKEIDLEAAFCPSCGAKQEQKKNLNEDEAAPSAAPTEQAKPDAKPLNAEEFIGFFKDTLGKYFTK